MGETQYDFRSKYTQANFVSRRLLEGYFHNLATMVAPLEVSSAVELGCGEGFSTSRIRGVLGDHVSFEASDVEERLVAAAREANPGIPIRQESIYALPRPDKSVDLAFVLEVLEHLEDPAAAMREACRVSRQWVLTSVPQEPLWCVMNLARFKYIGHLGNTPGHIQHWSTRGFRRFIGQFAEVREVRTPLPWTMVLARVK